MKIQIVNNELSLDIYGYSGIAIGKDYSGTAFKLMDKMWQTIRSNHIKNKGLNIWAYEPGDRVFAGVELEGVPDQETGLELKSIRLKRYASYKHVGPYNQIKQVGQAMRDELKQAGLLVSHPYLEIYGHWNSDETKLETELLICIE